MNTVGCKDYFVFSKPTNENSQLYSYYHAVEASLQFKNFNESFKKWLKIEDENYEYKEPNLILNFKHDFNDKSKELLFKEFILLKNLTIWILTDGYENENTKKIVELIEEIRKKTENQNIYLIGLVDLETTENSDTLWNYLKSDKIKANEKMIELEKYFSDKFCSQLRYFIIFNNSNDREEFYKSMKDLRKEKIYGEIETEFNKRLNEIEKYAHSNNSKPILSNVFEMIYKNDEKNKESVYKAIINLNSIDNILIFCNGVFPDSLKVELKTFAKYCMIGDVPDLLRELAKYIDIVNIDMKKEIENYELKEYKGKEAFINEFRDKIPKGLSVNNKIIPRLDCYAHRLYDEKSVYLKDQSFTFLWMLYNNYYANCKIFLHNLYENSRRSNTEKALVSIPILPKPIKEHNLIERREAIKLALMAAAYIRKKDETIINAVKDFYKRYVSNNVDDDAEERKNRELIVADEFESIALEFSKKLLSSNNEEYLVEFKDNSILAPAVKGESKTFLSDDQVFADIHKRFHYFVPILLMCLNGVFHLTFVILFSITTLWDPIATKNSSQVLNLKTAESIVVSSPGTTTYVAHLACYLWILGTLWLEIFDLMDIGKDYFKLDFWNIWNYTDILGIILFLVGWHLRYYIDSSFILYGRTSVEIKLVSKLFLGLAFIIWCTRLVQFFLLMPIIGTNLRAIAMMFRELIFFLFILFSFTFAFGVAALSIMYPYNDYSDDRFENFKFMINMAYFATFGNSDGTDYIEPENCTKSNSTYQSDNPCTDENGRIIIYVLFIVYVMIMNGMVLNLLIASFNVLYTQTKDRATIDFRSSWAYALHKNGNFHRNLFKNIMLGLPSPLSLISMNIIILFSITSACCCLVKKKKKKEENRVFRDSSIAVIDLEKN